MMLYPPMSDLLENVNSRYLLVNVISRRARQVSIEAEKLGEPLSEKPVSIAIGEIADGRLTASLKTEEDYLMEQQYRQAAQEEAADEPYDEPQEEPDQDLIQVPDEEME